MADAFDTGEGRECVAPAGDLEAGDVELSIGGIDGAVEGRRSEIASDADDAGLRAGAAMVPEDAEQIRLIEADLHHLVVERAHLGVEEPDLGKGGGVDRMGNPGERLGDGRRVFLPGQLIAQETVKLVVFNDMNRRAGDVLSLLVAGGDETRARIDGEIGLAEAMAE